MVFPAHAGLILRFEVQVLLPALERRQLRLVMMDWKRLHSTVRCVYCRWRVAACRGCGS